MRTKENKGVTIIALAVTIIVMLILAGVSIATLTGDGGIVSNANKVKVERKISEFEEVANLIYSEKYIEKSGTGEEISVDDIIDGVEEKGYKINRLIFNDPEQMDIILSQEIITLGIGESKKITIKSRYYVEIYAQNYEIAINNGKIELLKSNIKVNEDYENNIYVLSNNSNLEVKYKDHEILLTDKGNIPQNYTLTLAFGICGGYTKNYSVSVVKKPTEVTENNNLIMQTDYGKIDIIWLDTENNVIEEPNKPILTANEESMLPIVWDDGKKIRSTEESDRNWYDYNRNKWANAKTGNDSYFVWIPRYAYRIAYYSDSTYSELTGLYDGLGAWKSNTGEIRENIEDGIKVVDYNGDKYIVHPAFETNLDFGGWSNELSGIWFAKFEISQDNNDIKSTYGVKSIRYKTLGDQYTMARQGKYGYIGTNDEDGYTSYMNSHMTKNSEWGAVVYLTESRYGKNGQSVQKCTEDDYTGGGNGQKYLDNINQSTTGNVYGIYDLCGGALESIACFNSVDKNANLVKSGWTSATGLNTKSSSTKYATKYNNKSNTYDSYDYNGREVIFQYGKTGDATKEVRKWEELGWHNEIINILYSASPFISRSGGAKENGVGIFYSIYSNGESSQDNTFRTVLCP